ncbi:MAG: hypothetical protein SFZ23_15080 [Planctomycetota bacterium]|nr:hypothetical protein [Planctomycetota bacterium]
MYSDGANWFGGVPAGPGDEAAFGIPLGFSCRVQFTQPASVGGVNIERGSVQFLLADNQIDVGQYLDIGAAAGDGGSLRVRSGVMQLTEGDIRVGTGSSGGLIVDPGGTVALLNGTAVFGSAEADGRTFFGTLDVLGGSYTDEGGGQSCYINDFARIANGGSYNVRSTSIARFASFSVDGASAAGESWEIDGSVSVRGGTFSVEGSVEGEGHLFGALGATLDLRFSGGDAYAGPRISASDQGTRVLANAIQGSSVRVERGATLEVEESIEDTTLLLDLRSRVECGFFAPLPETDMTLLLDGPLPVHALMSIDEGVLDGRLTVGLGADRGSNLMLGDVFTMLESVQPLQGSFSEILLPRLNRGLTLQPVVTSNALSFVVVPGPGVPVGALMIAGWMTSRGSRRSARPDRATSSR